MDTKKAKKATQEKPYDDSMGDHWSMYNNMPYVWDPDLNVDKVFKIVSGNIIKSYRCVTKEPYEVKHE